MKSDTGRLRRTRTQWEQLVVAWRRSRLAAPEFAADRGVVESTLRWWAWRLERDRERDTGDSALALVPVRVADEPPAVGDSTGAAWTLRTSRGELTVYCADASALRAAVSSVMRGDP
jgi:hypothetical protein